MKKITFLIALIMLMAVFTAKSQTATAPAIGDGTSGNPYQIATLDNLYWISQNTVEWSKYYVQTADINAGETSTWDAGSGFTPIGNNTTNFTGGYNGAGHTIGSLYIKRPGTDYIGLFGYANGANIDSLGLNNVDITGNDYTGGLVGDNDNSSTVSNSYSTGSVSGDSNVGGLVGNNYSSTVNNSYSTGSISGSDYVGGLVGYNYFASTVNNSYSTGSISGSGYCVGGLVGYNYSIVSNSFWDIQTSGQTTSYGGTGKTTAEMKDYNTFTNVSTEGLTTAWDFVGNFNDDTGTNDYWGLGAGNNEYPVLIWQSAADSLFSIASSDSITNINTTTATGNGNILHLGSSNPTVYGFCWNTAGNPDISDNNTDEGTTSNTGTFTTNITGLIIGEKYYSRAYTINEYGTCYGKVLEIGAGGVGLVNTDNIFSITDSTAIGYGNITDLGTSNPTAYGFCWNTTGNPDISDSKTDEGIASITGTFSTNITGLTSNTTYYAKAYVTNVNGTYYGDEIELVVIFPSGSGTELDPYQIESLGNLQWLMENSAKWNKYYIQTADIDASVTIAWDYGKGFTPIGNNTTKFTGEYNGASYTIDSLYINRPETDYIGLFGYTNGSKIDSLGLTNVNITGNDYTGGLVGDNDNFSTVSNSYSTGSVSGDECIGGLVGDNNNSSTVGNSYSTGSVSGSSNYVGGLIGDNGFYSTVSNSYSTGSVNGSSNYVGGLVGCNWSSTVSNSFWDIQTSGQTTSYGGTGKTTAEMKDYNTFTDVSTEGLDSAWDFVGNFNNDTGTSDYWCVGGNDGYLIFTWQDSLFSIVTSDSITNINITTATGNGNILYLGSSNPTAYGFCWNTIGNPDISGSTTNEGQVSSTVSFTTNITGLTIDEKYYSRAYTTNEYGTYYGKVLEFGAGGVGLVTTDGVFNIADSIAFGYGNITDLGTSNPTAYGFCWNTTGNPDTSDSKTDEGTANITGTFSTKITGLTSNTTYYAKAYVTNVNGTYYGDEIEIVVIFPSGSGTELDPYQIASLGNLQWLMQNSSKWDKYYIQTADINASITNVWADSSGFTPIGNYTTNFTGEYNGAGHTIDSLYIERPETDNIGLFGYTNGSKIDSLGLTNVDFTGKDYVGGIVGCNQSSSIVSNSYSTGSINGTDNVGGLIGFNLYSSIVSNSYNTGSVNGSSYYVGGLVGCNSRSSTVSNSYNTGSVSGTTIVGGLVGNNYFASTVSNSYNTGSVSGSSYSVGGLIGCNQLNSTVSNSYNTGSVSGSDHVGGLVGYNKNGSINNSYSTGSISGSDYVGGLVGYNYFASTVNNSYSTGSVSGSDYVGGLVGCNYNNSIVSNSFWDTETSGIDSSASGTGKITAEMKNLCTYVYGTEESWDFMDETINGTNDFWGMNASENGGYPFLAWQGYSHTSVCCQAPTNAVTNITFGTISETTINLSNYNAPTNGADGYAIYVNSSNSFIAPNNGDEPTADLSWNNSGQQCIYFGTATSPNIIVSELTSCNTTYYFKVYAYNDCSGYETYETTGADTSNLTIDETSPTITCIDNQEVNADDTHTYTVSGIEFNPIAIDDNCSIASILNDFNNTATLNRTSLPEGTITIVWTVTDDNGNAQNCSFDVQVNAYSGINNNVLSNGISIYPNPANNFIVIESKEINIESIEIINITGKVVKQIIINGNKATIDLSDKTKGLYMIRLITNKRIIIKKVMFE
ncbi:MAG: T9SS type A sorting domain-containing protein [Bacteroidales bacterium]|nr:T9SS type A sorting domain-containing protein [Bacteroidales bacterium]